MEGLVWSGSVPFNFKRQPQRLAAENVVSECALICRDRGLRVSCCSDVFGNDECFRGRQRLRSVDPDHLVGKGSPKEYNFT